MGDSAPDPARLTDRQIAELEADVREGFRESGPHIGAAVSLIAALRADRARLAAAENVVEAARKLVAALDRSALDSLPGEVKPARDALAAYDAHNKGTP